MAKVEEKVRGREKDIDNAFKNLKAYFTKTENMLLTSIHRNEASQETLFEEARKKLHQTNVDVTLHKEIIEKLKDYFFGYYRLQPLLDNPDVSDIRCHSADSIRVKLLGNRYGTDVKFEDNEEFKSFVNTVAVKNGKNLSMINAQQIFTDIDSHPAYRLRIDIQTDFLNTERLPFMHIRKIPKDKLTLDELAGKGDRVKKPMMTTEVRDFIRNQIKANRSMIICGPNASGKTYLLNANIDEYPINKSGLVMQESDELFSYVHKDILFQHTIINQGDGKISYNLKDEIRYGLMSDNDLFVVGEIKDEAALYAINAAYTGSTCWFTVHSENSREAIQKVADYAMYEAKYSIDKVYKELSFMNMVIFVKDFEVKEITMIIGSNEDGVVLDTVYDVDKKICNLDMYYKRVVSESKGIFRTKGKPEKDENTYSTDKNEKSLIDGVKKLFGMDERSK